jgi:uroporphyrinogen decarboxylase
MPHRSCSVTITRQRCGPLKDKPMSNKKLILDALQCRETPRAPWLPYVGVHGAKLLDVTATEYLHDAALIARGQEAAAARYQADGIPVVFDLQLEAEALGCALSWADDGPPSVASHPAASCVEVLNLPPMDVSKGRFPVAGEATRRLARAVGDRLAVYGLVCGPFTLLSHLRGSGLFLDMLMDPEGTLAAMHWCADCAIKAAHFYLEHGADVIAIVDPMVSQISVQHFEEFVSEPVSMVADAVHDGGALASLFVCGDATRNLEAMFQTRCDNLSVDENVDLELLRALGRKHKKSYGGNIRLTMALLLGKEDDAKLDTIRCLDSGTGPGFILAPGCDLPFATPPENLCAVAQMNLDPYQREVARQTAQAGSFDWLHEIELPDYDGEEAVILDCVTLDSAACAPCQYMMDAARAAAEKAGVPVLVNEHKIKRREGIGVMCRLDVKNVPTICIDGIPEFVSLIPDLNTLVAAIEQRYREKHGA